MRLPKEKSPYKRYTVEEIRKAEEGVFLIQLGIEFYDFKKRYKFSKKTADQFYDVILADLRAMLKNPKKKDKEAVLSTLLNLRIIPLRFH